jgi:hypothetical protein
MKSSKLNSTSVNVRIVTFFGIIKETITLMLSADYKKTYNLSVKAKMILE